jgi:O-antigen ligase
VATFSRAGYIAVVISAIAGIILLRGIRLKEFLIISVMLLLLFLTSELYIMPDWLSNRLVAPDSSLVRIPRFWAGVDFLWDNIKSGWQTALFGKGYIASYLLGGYYIQQGYNVGINSDFFLDGGFHNGYLTLLVDQGILAFICYAVILVAAGRRLLRYCAQFKLYGNWEQNGQNFLEVVGWGLVIIVHLVTETVHWQSFFPQRFYFFMALAMVFNLTSPEHFKAFKGNEAGAKP